MRGNRLVPLGDVGKADRGIPAKQQDECTPYASLSLNTSLEERG